MEKKIAGFFLSLIAFFTLVGCSQSAKLDGNWEAKDLDSLELTIDKDKAILTMFGQAATGTVNPSKKELDMEADGEKQTLAYDLVGDTLALTIDGNTVSFVRTDSNKTEKESSEKIEVTKTNDKGVGVYESIYNEYSQKLKEVNSRLIKEYRKEAQANLDNDDALYRLLENKIESLTKIYDEGEKKMDDHYFADENADDDEYDEWSEKLYEAYSNVEEQLSEIYYNL